jgi:hypothetical protein
MKMHAGFRWAAAVALVATLPACSPTDNTRQPRSTLVLAIDVSGSFRSTGHYADAIDFAAHYLYGHLNALGELRSPTAVFVGSIGGERQGEVKSFQPIHAFQGKSVEEIKVALSGQFPPQDAFTDFNAFFDRVATLVKRQGLVLAPLNIVVISDGVPDIAGGAPGDPDARYTSIKLNPLEFLSRSVTVRLLYPSPTVAVSWERLIERRRVRMWTVDDEVMHGWREQLQGDLDMNEQDQLWKWMLDNVDFRVRSRVL